MIDRKISGTTTYDLLFIPGGNSALTAARDSALMDWIRQTSATAERVMAVCTGTVLLGMTRVLDGRDATTNKMDFTETVPLAPSVNWIRKARRFVDGNSTPPPVSAQAWIWHRRSWQTCSGWTSRTGSHLDANTNGTMTPTAPLRQTGWTGLSRASHFTRI